MKRVFALILSLALVFGLAACSGTDASTGGSTAPAEGSEAAGGDSTAATGDEVTLEFIQWWEPELPDGSFRAIMDKFEEANPGIKVELISGPFKNIKEQVVVGATSGTLSDVVGLDGTWVNDLAKQGAIANMSDLMSSAGFDDKDIAAQIKVDGGTYMIPVVTFVYPMYVNLDMLEAAGIENPPSTRTEFLDAARKLTKPDENVYAWALPLLLAHPTGANHDVMSWVWASGEQAIKDGQPDLNNEAVKEVYEFIQTMYDENLVAPGAFSMEEVDKVQEFTNGRVAMVINTMAHITTIRESNPDLNFTVIPVPAAEGYDGQRGMDYAAWGIGVSESSQHKEEAWKLVEFLMSTEINSELSSIANAFPGNSTSEPDFVKTDELFAKAFEIFQDSYLINEFTGVPVSEELQRKMNEYMQQMLDGNITVDEALASTQAAWEELYEGGSGSVETADDADASAASEAEGDAAASSEAGSEASSEAA